MSAARELKRHYAELNDQHLKNLANGLVRELEKKHLPESAEIVRQLIKRWSMLQAITPTLEQPRARK